MPKGKKKSTKTINGSSSFATNNDLCSLQDEIVQHLPCLRKSKGLVIGLSAALRGIRTQSLSAVLLLSRKAIPPMHHALAMMCRDRDVLLLQLQNAILHSHIPTSIAYGLKANVLSQDVKFQSLLEKINNAKSCRKAKKTESLWKEIPAAEKQASCLEGKRTSFKCCIHPKHCASRNTGKAETFISLDEYTDSKNDFPDYVSDWSEFSIHIE